MKTFQIGDTVGTHLSDGQEVAVTIVDLPTKTNPYFTVEFENGHRDRRTFFELHRLAEHVGDDDDTLPRAPRTETNEDLRSLRARANEALAKASGRPMMAPCGQCGNLVRPGMVGMEDHSDGCQSSSPDVPTNRRESSAAYVLGKLVPAPGDLDPETPGRFVRALDEFTSGYGTDLASLLKTFPIPDGMDPGIVTVKGIPFASLCEHHVLPFTGTVSVAYIPTNRIVGLSKIPRLVRAVTRRLQVQERIGVQVADSLMEHVGAAGTLVLISGRHTCMALRGVESPGEMLTSCARGVFRTDEAARAEVMSLLR